jgi:RNA polymerase sigma factor (sigma-70 family)
MTSERTAQLAAFYAENQARLRRLVGRYSHANRHAVEDACQIAWAILVRRADIPLDGRGFAWLRTVALTTGLRGTAARDIPAGGFLPAARGADPRELPEPTADQGDPLELVLASEHHEELHTKLLTLTERERRYLALQAAGLSYREIAAIETGVSLRTIERQILRGRRKLKERG